MPRAARSLVRRRSRGRALRAVPLLAAVAGALVLAGCAGDDEPLASVPVVVPGSPGGPATTVAPGQPVPSVTPEVTEADVVFVVGMIPHHEQALVLARLAPGRAADPSVLGLAARIDDVQDAEIDAMERWLSGHGLTREGRPVGRDAGHDDHAGHGAGTDHAAMGMASEADLERLRASSGADFDKLWLQLMIAHHEGAIAMSEQHDVDGGLDETVRQMAADVAADQAAEIRRMQQVLAQL